MTTFTHVTDKRVSLILVSGDDDIFAILAAFRSQAQRESWTKEEISAVLDQAKMTDYDSALYTIMQYCGNGGFGVDEPEGDGLEEYGDGDQYS